MKRFIYGFDGKQPWTCAEALRANGIDAVVTGSADRESADAIAASGLELYLCFGALRLRQGDEDTSLARDTEGRDVRWFGSGCPNDPEIRKKRLEAALETLLNTPSARGLFEDGARFASFASGEGAETFFTCFCPRCMETMRERGLDPDAIRLSVRRLSRRQAGPEDFPRLREWFFFRAETVRLYMAEFAEAVHSLPGQRLAGGFVFAPSLSGFVGQTPEAWQPLDIVSPMLYRHYPHPDGPACLDHEWGGAMELCGIPVLKELNAIASEVSGLRSLFPAEKSSHLREEGFPPERIGAELTSLRGKLRSGQLLMPILQIDDPRLSETERCAASSGADGTGFFAYGLADVEVLSYG